MIKSINIEEFKKAMDEDKSKSAEEFLEKIFNTPITEDNIMEKTKEILHKQIDELKTEKDFEKFCLRMVEIVLQHYREKVIGDEWWK